MNNYLNNNVLLINEYEKLYSDGIRIDEVTKSGEVLVVFTDSFNKRNDVIKILLCDLKCFLNQKALYTGIPGQTDVLLMQRME